MDLNFFPNFWKLLENLRNEKKSIFLFLSVLEALCVCVCVCLSDCV